MANNSLTILTNRFFALVLKSPIQMGWLSIINSVTNMSRLGTFNQRLPTDSQHPIFRLSTVLSAEGRQTRISKTYGTELHENKV
jgi:hypothetical protein